MAPQANDNVKDVTGSLPSLDKQVLLTCKDLEQGGGMEDVKGSLLEMDRSSNDSSDSEDAGSRSPPRMSARIRVIHTVLIFCTFLGFGLCRGVYGPTLVELRTVTGVSLTQISMLFTCLGVGGIAGSLIFGRLFDMINPLVLFVVSLSGVALVTALIPWLHIITGMMAACAAHSFLYSGLAIGCTVTLFRLWGECSKQIFLSMHLLYTVGGFLAPLLAEPFLTPPEDTDLPNLTNTTTRKQPTANSTYSLEGPQGHFLYSEGGSGSDVLPNKSTEVGEYALRVLGNISEAGGNKADNSTSMMSSGVPGSFAAQVSLAPLQPRFSMIVYTYLLIGIYLFMVAVAMFCLLLHMRNKKTGVYWRKSQAKGDKLCQGGGSLYRLIATILFMAYNVHFGGQETVYSGLLFTFAVEHVGFTPSMGTLLVSILYTAHTLGRFLIIIVSHWVPNALYVLLVSAAGCAVSCSLLAYYTTTSVPALWAVAVLGGLSLSTMYSMGLLWAKDFMPISASFTSFYTIAYTTGMMLCPPLTSYFMRERGPAWFAYMNLIMLLGYTTAIGLLFILQRCKHRFNDYEHPQVKELEYKVKPHDDLMAHSMHSLHTV